MQQVKPRWSEEARWFCSCCTVFFQLGWILICRNLGYEWCMQCRRTKCRKGRSWHVYNFQKFDHLICMLHATFSHVAVCSALHLLCTSVYSDMVVETLVGVRKMINFAVFPIFDWSRTICIMSWNWNFDYSCLTCTCVRFSFHDLFLSLKQKHLLVQWYSLLISIWILLWASNKLHNWCLFGRANPTHDSLERICFRCSTIANLRLSFEFESQSG
jgi:hypothetical protein